MTGTQRHGSDDYGIEYKIALEPYTKSIKTGKIIVYMFYDARIYRPIKSRVSITVKTLGPIYVKL